MALAMVILFSACNAPELRAKLADFILIKCGINVQVKANLTEALLGHCSLPAHIYSCYEMKEVLSKVDGLSGEDKEKCKACFDEIIRELECIGLNGGLPKVISFLKSEGKANIDSLRELQSLIDKKSASKGLEQLMCNGSQRPFLSPDITNRIVEYLELRHASLSRDTQPSDPNEVEQLAISYRIQLGKRIKDLVGEINAEQMNVAQFIDMSMTGYNPSRYKVAVKLADVMPILARANISNPDEFIKDLINAGIAAYDQDDIRRLQPELLQLFEKKAKRCLSCRPPKQDLSEITNAINEIMLDGFMLANLLRKVGVREREISQICMMYPEDQPPRSWR